MKRTLIAATRSVQKHAETEENAADQQGDQSNDKDELGGVAGSTPAPGLAFSRASPGLHRIACHKACLVICPRSTLRPAKLMEHMFGKNMHIPPNSTTQKKTSWRMGRRSFPDLGVFDLFSVCQVRLRNVS